MTPREVDASRGAPDGVVVDDVQAIPGDEEHVRLDHVHVGQDDTDRRCQHYPKPVLIKVPADFPFTVIQTPLLGVSTF